MIEMLNKSLDDSTVGLLALGCNPTAFVQTSLYGFAED